MRLQPARVDGLGPRQVGAQQRRQCVLAGAAAIGELRSQGGARAGVEAQRGRTLGGHRQETLADAVEDRLRGVLGRRRRRRRGWRLAASGEQAGGHSGAQRGHGLAARGLRPVVRCGIES
jgi:hypothetical protein